MSRTYLLLDYGASRVKAAIYNDGNVECISDYTPVKPYDTENKKFVIGLNKLANQFREIVKTYDKQYTIGGIYICSEMHGFALVDKNNQPISDYISWKDERCLNTVGGKSSFELLKEKYGDKFRSVTGMNPRPCYPFYNLYEYLKTNDIKETKVISLPEWLCTVDNQSKNLSHITMSAGLGFFNIYKKEYDEDLINIFKNEYNVDLLFNTVSEKVSIGGYININNRNIPIYTGVGDHQCAVLGAGNTENTISLNLGTGSQVGLINSKSQNSEKRPFFDGKFMSVITHIPSGRSFNTFIGFLNEINPNIDFWELLSSITLEELNCADLNIDLAVFSSAWNFNKYGRISNINEKNLNLKNFLASLLKNYVLQYDTAIKFIGEKRDKIILSGGIAIKISVLEQYFISKGYQTSVTENKIDETFNGLCIIIDNRL